MEKRFILQQSETQGHYVVTDRENGFVIKFEAGKFNETQKITDLEDQDPEDFMAMARVMREIGDWLVENHSDKI